MTKIMLVEDDNNLREIYEARLLAEGYEIVSAKDGEEALALAVKEKPELIISDVMMPKISGFDMLDILRSTPEIKNTKVIMMTALSQAEDKARADKLGADRYLVKSQVTLEDVARVAHEVISGEEGTPSTLDTLPGATAPASTQVTAPEPPTSASLPLTPPPATEPPEEPPAPTVPPATPTPVTPPEPPVSADPATTAADPPVVLPEAPTADPVADEVTSPASDPSPLDATSTDSPDEQSDTNIAQSAAEESATIDEQIQDFVAQAAPEGQDSEEPAVAAPAPALQNESDALDLPGTGTDQVTTDLSSVTAPVETIAVQTAPPATAADGTATNAPETAPAPVATAAEAPQPEVPTPDSQDGSVPVAHKKVISPISEAIESTPDLNDLLAKQKQKDALAPGVSVIPPADSVIQPGGATVTPASNNTPPTASEPGNIVHPGGSDPTSIAL
ncbi:MAG TPA: response regulator [Candidatus Limnocylindrales bacterium]|nr:response regulator [Candidatus Limnocylindrales bacterium]